MSDFIVPVLPKSLLFYAIAGAFRFDSILQHIQGTDYMPKKTAKKAAKKVAKKVVKKAVKKVAKKAAVKKATKKAAKKTAK